MKPQGAKYDLVIDKGSSFDFAFTWKDKNGAPINNTGFTFTLQAKDARTKATVINLTSPTNITVGGSNGKVSVHVDDEVTPTYTFDVARYNLEYSSPTGDRKRLLYGYITTVEDVLS